MFGTAIKRLLEGESVYFVLRPEKAQRLSSVWLTVSSLLIRRYKRTFHHSLLWFQLKQLLSNFCFIFIAGPYISLCKSELIEFY